MPPETSTGTIVSAPAEPESGKCLAIAATFTADLIQDPLAVWFEELGWNAHVELAPYNQVFQTLLGGDSVFATNRDGVNIILLRWEDIGEPVQVRENAQKLTEAIRLMAPQAAVPLIVAICPPTPHFAAEEGGLIEELNGSFAAALSGASNVHLLTTEQLARWYSVANAHDERGERLGHIPYTAEFFSALATFLVRRIEALSRSPYKVVVLDLDNTVWRGVVGEDGPQGVEIDAPRRALQEFMVRQHDAGMLVTVCSKNNEADVEELFQLRDDMLLRRSHIVAWRVNWSPKSANIRELAAELDLGIDSFIFVDDSPAECAEVRANCPEVLVLQLPENVAEIPDFLNHVWAFDNWTVTADDKNRTAVYTQKLEREKVERQATDISEFIASLGLEMDIVPMPPEQLPRVSQLTQRTNQFNFTTIRRSEGEIQQMLNDGAECLTVDVRDRFGAYGLVGAVIYRTSGDALTVDSFLLSCRALARGVEHGIIRHLGETAVARGLKQVVLPIQFTAKNTPARIFLESIAGNFRHDVDNGFVLELPAEHAAKLTYQPGAAVSIPKDEGKKKAASAKRQVSDFARFAMDLRLPSRVAERVRARKLRSADTSAVLSAPKTHLEQRVAEIWANVLGLPAVGRDQNFFEIGGTSLLAVEMMTAVIDEFANDNLTLSAVLDAPTVVEFAQLLSQGGSREYRSLVCMRTGADRPPFYCIHGGGGNVLSLRDLAMAMPDDLPFYCLQAKGLDGSEPFGTIEETAAFYVSEIQKHQPHGPYYIGGGCYGGLIAFEMARKLVSLGEEVGLVALIDTYNHAYGSILPLHKTVYCNVRFIGQRVAHHAKRFGQLNGDERRGYISGRVKSMAKHLNGFTLLLTGGSKTQVVGDAPLGVPTGEVTDRFEQALIRVVDANMEAQRNYVPKPYSGEILVFRASDRFVEPYQDPHLGWGPMAEGGVDVVEVPGDHTQITAEPNVRILAAALDERLRKAVAAHVA